MSKPKIFIGKVNQGRPPQEICSGDDLGAKAASAVERITANVELPPEPQPTINYILGGPVNDQYQSKSQNRRLL